MKKLKEMNKNDWANIIKWIQDLLIAIPVTLTLIIGFVLCVLSLFTDLWLIGVTLLLFIIWLILDTIRDTLFK